MGPRQPPRGPRLPPAPGHRSPRRAATTADKLCRGLSLFLQPGNSRKDRGADPSSSEPAPPHTPNFGDRVCPGGFGRNVSPPAHCQVCFPHPEALCHLVTKPWAHPDLLESGCTNLEPAPRVTSRHRSGHPDAGGCWKSQQTGQEQGEDPESSWFSSLPGEL